MSKNKKVLVIGSGGREHALACKFLESPQVSEVHVAPGNPGMERDPVALVKLKAQDFVGLEEYIKQEKIDFVMVGPELPLTQGIVDRLRKLGVPTLGPTQKAAYLEASKAFSKQVMLEAQVPTAEFKSFTEVKKALEFIEQVKWEHGLVLKASELASGKGVVVCESKEQARQALRDLMESDRYSVRSQEVVIEERLVGQEVSAFYLCDGKSFVELGLACDYKSLNEGGQGPNTGGMGTYSPANWVTPQVRKELATVPQKIMAVMDKRGTPFTGILFVGVMVTEKGPQVLEFNVRLGDPETQSLLPLIEADLFEYFYKAAIGELGSLPQEMAHKKQTAVHVVLTADGYPGTERPIRQGDEINLAQDLYLGENVRIYFAGVGKNTQGKLITQGGRVLGLTALAGDRESARELCYREVHKVHFFGAHFRKDIGV